MSLTRKDAQDAVLAGVMRVRRWQEEFMAGWLEPEMKLEEAKQLDQAVAAWDAMPEQVKAELKEQYPAQYAAAEKKVNALKGAQK